MKVKLPKMLILAGLLVVILVVVALVLPRLPLPNLNNQEGETENQVEQPTFIHEIILTDQGFTPTTITIKKGETVSFINQSGENATVNSSPHPIHNLYRFLNLGEFPDGTSVQAIFEETGSYSYHNHFNPSQQGTIVVE